MSTSRLPIQKRVSDLCPKCGANNLEQYKTDRFSATYVVRYYQCRSCGQRFKTEDAR